jgi:hypothetical protein
VLNNLFGPDACVTLLLFKIQPDYWKALKSFLLFLNLLREGEMSDIVEDENVLDTLRKL